MIARAQIAKLIANKTKIAAHIKKTQTCTQKGGKNKFALYALVGPKFKINCV